MNLKHLSDEELHQKTLILVSQERCVTTEILHHLREVSVRRLYAAKGYSSLWEYCIGELRYSEPAAQRRIAAMKILAEIPEIEEKLHAGKLSLSIVSHVQSVCKKKPHLKREALKAVEGKSRRQAEMVLAAIAPQKALPEKRRALNESQTEVRFVVSKELDAKLERIKNLTSHKKFNPSYAELIEMMADMVLDRIDPEKKRKSNSKSFELPPPAEVRKRISGTATRYIRAETKRAVFERAGSRCEYVDKDTKHRCEETKCLQIDHVIPFAHGGNNDLTNLQLLCAAHNRFRAIQTYGLEKMKPFLVPDDK
jgi:hypothetical protein